MRNPLASLLERLSVGRKLLLIYLLDLSAVIFVSGILINEKFIAIDFARKELAGNAYIMALRQPLLAVADVDPLPDRQTTRSFSAAVRAIETVAGANLDSAALNEAFAGALDDIGASGSTGATGADASVALTKGRELVTRIGNKSNLILDPDLDSYYTMSLILLRYPELLFVSRQITVQMLDFVASGQPMTAEMQTQYFILEGRLDAISSSIESDFAEAFSGAEDERLKTALDPQRALLIASIERFRTAGRAMMQGGDGGARLRPSLGQLLAFDDALLRRLDSVWLETSGQLNRLIEARIDGFFHRMWLHLGTALFLLSMILVAVFMVARHIAAPLRRLSQVAEAVGRTGDRGTRVAWRSTDEIGRLVVGFNDMLDQLSTMRSAEQELVASARAAAAQRELVEAVPIPMVVTAIPLHEVLHANGPAQAWLNGRTQDPWAEGLEPRARSLFFQHLADQDVVGEYEVRWHGGTTPTWAVLSARRLVYQGQDAIVTAFTPINHMKLLEQRLVLWAKVFEASSESIMIVDADHRILSVNRAWGRGTGHDMRDVIGDSPDFLLDATGLRSFGPYWSLAAARNAWQGEVSIRRRDGSAFPAWMVISPVRDGAGHVTHYICASLDISERKAAEERIRYLAHHDSLTALPNRLLCIERLRVSIGEAERSGQKIAVLFVDLDHFKTINDSLGHHVGDGLLRSVAQRLLDEVRGRDTVARLGGDEFIVVLNDVVGADAVQEAVEQRLIPAVRRPHVVGDASLQVSCSVGIAIYPDDAETIDELLRLADVAMYEAKTTGRDAAHRFTSDLDARAHRKLRLQSLLRLALERAEFALEYQPKVCAADRTLVGVEALLRWHSAELGPVTPAEFIPIAEESRLITSIGAWVVDQALLQHASWRAAGHGDIPVSINVSALQLRNGDFVHTVDDALRRHGVASSSVELELTESTLIDGLDGTLDHLRALKALGLSVSVDDFGTGYSSLTYLNRFPIDRVKIDRSFIRDLLVNPADLAITKAIIGLGHALGLTVIAEGVETEGVCDALLAASCDELQGNHFSAPLSVEAFEAWLAEARIGAAGSRRLRLV